MHIIYIDKNIMLQNIINEINLINIDEDIQYLNRNDGVLIKGYINIECEYLSLGVIKSFIDKAEVAILIPYENVITNELQFKLLDFDYLIKNNNLSLSFKINIEGYKEIEKSFQDEAKEMEIVSNLDVELSEVKKILEEKQEIIELDEVPDNLIIVDNNINDEEKSNIIDEIEEKDLIKNLEDDLFKDIEEDLEVLNEGKRMVFNINGNQEILEKEIVENNIKENNSFFNSIFKKDKKIKMWKYRVVLENDNYEDIAKEYNVNLYKLKEINKNTNLEIGKIIKIPNYHE